MYSCCEVIIVRLILQETGGMFKGMFKKTPKPFARTQSQVRVVRLTCLTCICITYLWNNNNNNKNNDDDNLCGIFIFLPLGWFVSTQWALWQHWQLVCEYKHKGKVMDGWIDRLYYRKVQQFSCPHSINNNKYNSKKWKQPVWNNYKKCEYIFWKMLLSCQVMTYY